MNPENVDDDDDSVETSVPNADDLNLNQSSSDVEATVTEDMYSESGSDSEREALRKKPSTFGHSSRQSSELMANVLRTSRWTSETKDVPFVENRYDWTANSKIGPMDRANRDEILKHYNSLSVLLPISQTSNAEFAPQSALNANRGSSRSAIIGTAKKEDILKQYNVLRAAQQKFDGLNVDWPDKTISQIDSRYRSQPHAHFGYSKRSDAEKLVNSLHVAMPKNMADVKARELLHHPKNDSRYRRVRGAEDWSKQKTKREDIHKLSNVLGASTYTTLTPDAGWPEDVYKVYKTALGGTISKASPEELQKHYNSLKVHIPHTETANVGYVDEPISKFDSKYATPPSFSMGVSKRADIFKQYNVLGAASPIGITDNVNYVKNPISKMDSRFKSVNCSNFGASITERDDVLKLHNNLGVYLPSNLTCNATFAKASDLDKTSNRPRASAASFGKSKRSAILKMANPLNSSMPIDRTPLADFSTKTISSIDSRFRKAPSATFGVSNREDALKLANTLNVSMPQKETSKTPFLLPDDHHSSITRNHARRGKGKWVDHEWGISSRSQHWKEANVMKVSVPFSAYTADVGFPEKIGFDISYFDKDSGKQRRVVNSRLRTTPGVTFGKSNREDVCLQFNGLSVNHGPHSNEIRKLNQQRMKRGEGNEVAKIGTTQAYRTRQRTKLPKCKIRLRPDKTSYKVVNFKMPLYCSA